MPLNAHTLKRFLWLVFLFLLNSFADANGQLPATNDSLASNKNAVESERYLQLPSINNNQFLNLNTPSQDNAERYRQSAANNAMFYLLLALTLFLGVLRTVFSKYFTNLFQVFFNSSIRQSQLTDQLLQGQLPSLLFNILFVCNAGLFLYFKTLVQSSQSDVINFRLIGLFTLGVVLVYCIKFLAVGFFGWLTGQKLQASKYLFMVFLINKMAGIFLLPVIIAMAFAPIALGNNIGWLGLALLSILFVVRQIRCFNIVQQQMKLSSFQFLLYIVALEILPLCLLYKAVNNYIN